MVQVSLGPDSCVCPDEGYVCHADYVTKLEWKSDRIPNALDYSSASDLDVDSGHSVNGFKSFLIDKVAHGLDANLTSQLFIIDPLLNGSNLTCEGATPLQKENKTLAICITGKLYLCIIHSVYIYNSMVKMYIYHGTIIVLHIA